MRKYMDYEVFSNDGEALLKEKSEDTLSKLVKKEDTPYAFRAAFTYDEDGELIDMKVGGNRMLFEAHF